MLEHIVPNGTVPRVQYYSIRVLPLNCTRTSISDLFVFLGAYTANVKPFMSQTCHEWWVSVVSSVAPPDRQNRGESVRIIQASFPPTPPTILERVYHALSSDKICSSSEVGYKSDVLFLACSPFVRRRPGLLSIS